MDTNVEPPPPTTTDDTANDAATPLPHEEPAPPPLYLPPLRQPQDVRPQVLVHNGLAFSIYVNTATGETQAATINARDFLIHPERFAQARIQKHADSGGLPTSHELTFDASFFGTQPVQVYAQDAAGNWGAVETYVLVQERLV